MNRCETCKHWGIVNGRAFPGDPRGPGGQRTCGRISDRPTAAMEELASELAYTEDGEDYYSAIFTKGDFGCVLWEPKQ